MLARIKKLHPELPVVIISGHGNIETAVTAIKRGAYDYIEKPFKADRLVLVTARALEASKLRRENKELKEKSYYSSDLIGKSAVMNHLRQSIQKVAPTNSRVMITGPQGSGKELAARYLHASFAASQRALRRGQCRLDGAGPGRDRVFRRRGNRPDVAQGRRARRSP